MNNREIDAKDPVVDLVMQAKHRPLPRSTKALTVFVIAALIFTGGIAYGKHRATSSNGAGLSLASLSGGGFGGGFGAGFGGRNRNGGATGATGSFANGAVPTGAPGFGAAASTDVAGTIVSVSATAVVIQTLSGQKQTFPLLTNTRVRVSTPGALAGVRAGDIVTIKPDSSNNAKTITVVK